jgi:hypothetical protein
LGLSEERLRTTIDVDLLKETFRLIADSKIRLGIMDKDQIFGPKTEQTCLKNYLLVVKYVSKYKEELGVTDE